MFWIILAKYLVAWIQFIYLSFFGILLFCRIYISKFLKLSINVSSVMRLILGEDGLYACNEECGIFLLFNFRGGEEDVVWGEEGTIIWEEENYIS